MIEFILFLAILLCSVILIVLGLSNYNSRYSDTPDKDKFSFLNQFPYELQDNETMKYNLYFRLVAALLGGLYAVFGVYCFFFLNIYGAKMIHDYILGILFILIGIVIFFEFIITLKDYKIHLITSSLLFSGTTIIYAYLGFFILYDPRETFNGALAYICFIIAAALLASLIFAPLKKWMYLEKREKNGTVNYYRKKIAILPFMEWIFIIANLILVLLISIF